ncbi:MAG: cytochrome c oxidase subunit I, partial [Cyanothece sp. SIO1E1]|nr:cytochrome c oxidase subunit I [Cyanothece sp. SIO1E1]
MAQAEITEVQANIPLPPPHPHEEERKWTDYFTFSTDHKVIGIQYLVTGFVFYIIGGVFATVMRTELATPAPDIVTPDVYNNLLTLHGTVMLFLWIVPAGAGLANYLIPLMIGARDMAFPRLNAIAFWLIPPSGILLIGSFFFEAPSAGWTSYPPLSLNTGLIGEGIWIMSILVGGTASILGGINFSVTILKMRVPSMSLNQMP